MSANRKNQQKGRNRSYNTRYSDLRKRLPFIPPRTKVTTSYTLRMAIRYIDHLESIMVANKMKLDGLISNSADGPKYSDFKEIAEKEWQREEQEEQEMPLPMNRAQLEEVMKEERDNDGMDAFKTIMEKHPVMPIPLTHGSLSSPGAPIPQLSSPTMSASDSPLAQSPHPLSNALPMSSSLPPIEYLFHNHHPIILSPKPNTSSNSSMENFFESVVDRCPTPENYLDVFF